MAAPVTAEQTNNRTAGQSDNPSNCTTGQSFVVATHCSLMLLPKAHAFLDQVSDGLHGSWNLDSITFSVHRKSIDYEFISVRDIYYSSSLAQSILIVNYFTLILHLSLRFSLHIFKSFQ